MKKGRIINPPEPSLAFMCLLTVILLTEPFLVIDLEVSTQNIFYTLGTFNPSCKWLFNLEWYSFISLERKLDVGQMEVPFSTFDLLQ